MSTTYETALCIGVCISIKHLNDKFSEMREEVTKTEPWVNEKTGEKKDITTIVQSYGRYYINGNNESFDYLEELVDSQMELNGIKLDRIFHQDMDGSPLAVVIGKWPTKGTSVKKLAVFSDAVEKDIAKIKKAFLLKKAEVECAAVMMVD